MYVLESLAVFILISYQLNVDRLSHRKLPAVMAVEAFSYTTFAPAKSHPTELLKTVKECLTPSIDLKDRPKTIEVHGRAPPLLGPTPPRTTLSHPPPNSPPFLLLLSKP